MPGLGVLAAISGGAKLIGKAVDYNYQRKLFDQQTNYSELMSRMRSAGITPAAAAQGISGSPGNSSPAFSGAGDNGISDIVSAHAQQREASTSASRADVQNQYDRLKMFYEPKLWNSQVLESYSRMSKNLSESKYFRELGGYWKESKEALHELRPWNLNQAIQTCSNLLATYDEIESRTKKNRQDTRTSASMERYYDAQTDKTYSEKFNIDQQGFQQMWTNDLLSVGINPNQTFFESLKRLMFSDPDKFKKILSSFVSTMSDLDNRFKASIGQNYKRNIGIAVALAYLQKRHLVNKKMRADIMNTKASALHNVIGSFVPFIGQGSATSSSLPTYDMVSGQNELLRMKNLGLILP